MKEISAGGVVYRTIDGRLEIQLIQDRYGKITLPKGKLESGETVEEAALREIEEETGIKGRILNVLEVVAYRYVNSERKTVDKEVHYFLVESVSGDLKAQIEEIRGVEWMTPGDAWEKQQNSGYLNNQSVLEKALKQLNFEVGQR